MVATPLDSEMGGKLEPPQPNAYRHSITWLLLKALPRMCRQASSEWVNDNAPRLGAAIAFYTLLSLAPVIVIAVNYWGLNYREKKIWLYSPLTTCHPVVNRSGV